MSASRLDVPAETGLVEQTTTVTHADRGDEQVEAPETRVLKPVDAVAQRRGRESLEQNGELFDMFDTARLRFAALDDAGEDEAARHVRIRRRTNVERGVHVPPEIGGARAVDIDPGAPRRRRQLTCGGIG